WATHSEVGLPDYGLASALGTIVLVLALFLMWIYHKLTAHQERFATITGKGYRPRQINLGKWKLPALLFCLIYVFIAVLLPFVMLLWTSVQPFYAPPSMDSFGRATFDGYQNIWRDSNVVRAVWNTTVLAVVTAVVTIALSVLVSWFVGRRRRESGPLEGYLATASFLPQGLTPISTFLALLFFTVPFPLPIPAPH